MTDACGRQIDYLRVSITDRCNLRCQYCMPQPLPFVPHAQILRYEEIVRLCRIAAGMGIRHLKITGGEPLVRKGCTDLMRQLKALDGIQHVTLTTNGVLLNDYLPALTELGIDGVNISLDTLDAALYQKITGRDEFDRVFSGLQNAVAAGLRVKVNCVLLPQLGDARLLAVAMLAQQYPVDVRFIEIMPIGSGRGVLSPAPEGLLALLQHTWHGLTPSDTQRGFGPARYFTAPELQGSIGLIDAVSHSFCNRCNRVRLTSEGFLKLCLCYSGGVDLRAMLRAGATDAELRAAMEAAIWNKPAHHDFDAMPAEETHGMSQIGG